MAQRTGETEPPCDEDVGMSGTYRAQHAQKHNSRNPDLSPVAQGRGVAVSVLLRPQNPHVPLIV